MDFKFLFWAVLSLLSFLGCSGAPPSEEAVGQAKGAICGSVTASFSPSSGQVGGTYTLTVTPGGCANASPEVRIDHRRPGSSTFVTDRNWLAAGTSYSWTTGTSNGGAAEAGGWHSFQILVRDPGNNAANDYDSVTWVDFYLNPGVCTGGSTSAAQGSVGQTITLNSSATGCTAEYRIDHLRPGSSTWQTDSGYAAGNSAYAWNTATANGGSAEVGGWHHFQILIRAQGSNAVYDTFVSYDYYLGTPNCSTITSSPSTRYGTIGETITITNSSSSCSTPTFRIDHLRPGASAWVTDSAYATGNSSYPWNTQTANGGNPEAPGWHQFQILVRANGSGNVYEAYTSFDVYLSRSVCSGITTSAAPSAGAAAGTMVTLTNSATGCITPEYRIDHLRPGGGSFQTDSAYSLLNSSYVWDTSTETPGYHYFQILARQNGSGSVYETYSTLQYYLSANSACTGASISTSPASPAIVGTAVTITGGATGCANAAYRYEYQVPGSSTWVALQDWTSSTTANWNTNLAATGTYNLRVLVRAAGTSGSGDANAATTYDLTAAPAGSGTSLSSLDYHVCELTSTGKVACWGSNSNGQLGSSSGAFSGSATPLTVSGISAVSVGAGFAHTCAVLSGGAVNCWGANQTGQLGRGAGGGSQTPVAVTGITNAASLAAGDSHTCVVLATGGVKCWGYNAQGQLGNGAYQNSTTPVTVPSITNAVQVAAGYYHSCALLTDATVKCWGLNTNGELGANSGAARSPTPLAVFGLTNVKSISAGNDSTCALKTDGTVWCWGANSEGQLGDNSTTARIAPVAVQGLTTTAVAIDEGTFHGCAALSDGSAMCWGLNGNGELGNSSTTNSHVAVPVTSMTGAIAVSAGIYSSCALRADGTAACWGRGAEGQLGNGATQDSLVPAVVQPIP
ncbi:MAG: hypothetical protein QM756_43890 [Polyangiaceae bacterium]